MLGMSSLPELEPDSFGRFVCEEQYRGGPPAHSAIVTAGPFQAIVTSKHIYIKTLAGCSPQCISAQSCWGETLAFAPIPKGEKIVAAPKRTAITLPKTWNVPNTNVVSSCWSPPINLGPFPLPPVLASLTELTSVDAKSSLHLLAGLGSQESIVDLGPVDSPRAIVWIPSTQPDTSVKSNVVSVEGDLDAPVEMLSHWLLIATGKTLHVWRLCRTQAGAGILPQLTLRKLGTLDSPLGESVTITSLMMIPTSAAQPLVALGGSDGGCTIWSCHSSYEKAKHSFSLSLTHKLPLHHSPLAPINIISAICWKQETIIACASNSCVSICLAPSANIGSWRNIATVDCSCPEGAVVTALAWRTLLKHPALLACVGDSFVQIHIDEAFRSISVRKASASAAPEDVPIRALESIFGVSLSPNELLVSSFHKRNVALEEKGAGLVKTVAGINYVRRVGDTGLRQVIDILVHRTREPKCFWDLFLVMSRISNRDAGISLRLIRYVRSKFILPQNSGSRVKEEALKVCNALYMFQVHHQPSPADKSSIDTIIASNRSSIRVLQAQRLSASLLEVVGKGIPENERRAAQFYLSFLPSSEAADLRAALQQYSTHQQDECVFCSSPVQRDPQAPLLGRCKRGHPMNFCCITFQLMDTSDMHVVRCHYCGVSGYDLRFSVGEWNWIADSQTYILCPFCGDLMR